MYRIKFINMCMCACQMRYCQILNIVPYRNKIYIFSIKPNPNMRTMFPLVCSNDKSTRHLASSQHVFFLSVKVNSLSSESFDNCFQRSSILIYCLVSLYFCAKECTYIRSENCKTCAFVF